VCCDGMGSYALPEECCTCVKGDDCDDTGGDDDDDYNINNSNINDNSNHKTKPNNNNNYSNQPPTLNVMLHIPSSRCA
jgi:hypothetical protein